MCEMERICTNFLFGYFELVHGAKLCAQCGISKIKKYILFDPPYCTYQVAVTAETLQKPKMKLQHERRA